MSKVSEVVGVITNDDVNPVIDWLLLSAEPADDKLIVATVPEELSEDGEEG